MRRIKLTLILATVSLFLLGNLSYISANQPEFTFPEIDTVHKSGITGKGFSIAIIDDGIDTTHPYFNGADILGVNINVDGSATIGREAAHKIGYHGPGAAGIVVGQKSSTPNNLAIFGDPIYGGWAPDARLIFISFDQYGESQLGQERAFEWIANNYKEYNIVAASLANWTYSSREWLPPCGGKLFPEVWERSVNKLLDTPVALIVAAGNSGQVNRSEYPGCMHKAISVGAFQNPIIDRVVNFSNLDPATISIVGPCCYVSSGSYKGERNYTWENYGGTSSVAPVIASLFALANQARPGISKEEVIAAMRETSTSYYEFGYNFPILNVKKFFLRLKEKTPIQVENIKGALNFKMQPQGTLHSPSPAPTVTVTAIPSPAPTVTVTANSQKFSIICTKGRLIKRVTSINPKCPPGYKKK